MKTDDDMWRSAYKTRVESLRHPKLDAIKEHWEHAGQVMTDGATVRPTTRDWYLGELERENILSYLKEDQVCLEIGCGDGYHTAEYAKKVKRLTGIDVAESLIGIAKTRLQCDLRVGSVLDIGEMFTERFDCVISQRCLINLPTWGHQKMAIDEVAQLLKGRGLFVCTEGFQEPLDDLNTVRRSLGLSTIKVVDYNRNLTIAEFEEFVQDYFEIIDRRYYGTYLFLSRTYHPLVVDGEPRHDSVMNWAASQIQRISPIPDLDKYSYNIAYILKKKS